MTPRPDLNKLAKEVFEANKAKGFHDEERSNETLLMLVITELSEAVEADRKGERADLEMMNNEITERNQEIWNILNNRVLVRPVVFHEAENESESDTFKKYFEYRIKDTIEDELADAVLRLLDLAGLRGYEITMYENRLTTRVKETLSEYNSFTEQVYEIITYVLNPKLYEYPYSVGIINYGLSALQDLRDILSIDLWLHVELKLKYNVTRPHKHGKKY